ncbi:ABC transporter permease [Candidatus Saccharibacteria bacterium]|nr:ABC transporter permease [Candidatus Saccharibacteria bacterium]
MTVFKAFLKIVSKNKFILILYSGILILFGGINIQTIENNPTNFTATKPTIAIINNDKNEGITKSLTDYLAKNSDVLEAKTEDEARDGLFYRDIHYIIKIPENYNDNFLDGKSPNLEIRKTSNYRSSFAEILLSRFLKVASLYQTESEEIITEKVKNTLSEEVTVEISSKVDTSRFMKPTIYYNFASYSILACLIYIICTILASFKNQTIKNRNLISSTSYKAINRNLLISNLLFAGILWLLYVLSSIFLIGKDTMFTPEGLLYIVNSFAFTLLATTIAFFIGNLISSKDAINGVTNVVALGSSFLCGVFVPLSMLPDSVVGFAHLIPTYYYVTTNDTIQNLENLNFESLQPIIINIIILLSFSLLFFILTALLNN